jgi:hypothetical protein
MLVISIEGWTFDVAQPPIKTVSNHTKQTAGPARREIMVETIISHRANPANPVYNYLDSGIEKASECVMSKRADFNDNNANHKPTLREAV